jgi:hypothetical protein
MYQQVSGRGLWVFPGAGFLYSETRIAGDTSASAHRPMGAGKRVAMDRIELVRHAVEQHLNDINDLLAMRLLFAPDNVVVPIEKEILDLYTYPERLETSHRDEWKSIAIKALHRNGFTDPSQTDQESVAAYLGFLRAEAIPHCLTEHNALFQNLQEILAIARAGNTIAFPDPRRRGLMRLIWPDHR